MAQTGEYPSFPSPSLSLSLHLLYRLRAPCTTDLPESLGLEIQESLLTIAASVRIKNLVHLGKKVIFSYFEEESQISHTKFDFC